MNTLETSILKTLTYFAHFKYAPTFEEIHTFLGQKISTKVLRKSIEGSVKAKKILKSEELYTLGEYSTLIDKTVQKHKITENKKVKIKTYISAISHVRSVKLIGYSGSVAMNNANLPDDIDLFIITEKDRMWITRLICLVFAQVLGIRRKRRLTQAQNKVCLNMFFDSKSLEVPKYKKTKFVAHEILQMKPVFNKKNTYENFLTANSWIFRYFPNAKKYTIKEYKSISKDIKKPDFFMVIIGNIIEHLAKSLQLFIINKHKTKEIITDTQLWFFPQDYEKKLPKELK